MPVNKERILQGRKAVDEYRTAHTNLYLDGWYKGIPEAHTPLLDILSLTLRKNCGFRTLDEFFTTSDELTAQELETGAIINIDEAWK